VDKLKIENYLKASPGAVFPEYRPLSAASAAILRDSLKRRFNIATDADPLTVARELDALGVVWAGFNAQDETFRVSKVLASARIAAREHAYVNWYRYDNIDKIRFDDLDRSLVDLWYPGADDIDIFDDSLGWVLSIAHHGSVKLAVA
jgi:hypothetical protein